MSVSTISLEALMHFFNSVKIDEIIKKGIKIYTSTLKSFIKFALLAVTMSYMVSIYVGILDTFLFEYELLYILAIVLLVLLFLPIAYYSIRMNMTAAGKFKALIEGQSFDFKDKYKESKHDFWRVFFVLAAKFIIRIMTFGALLPMILFIISLSSPDSLTMQLNGVILFIVLFISGLVTLALFYLLTRLEFASLIIFWKADVDKSDLDASIKMTQTQYFSKLKLIIIAHIPNAIISLVTLLNIIYNFQGTNLIARWGYILGLIGFNTMAFSWSMGLYYPLFKSMKAFPLQTDKVIDEEGHEWQTF